MTETISARIYISSALIIAQRRYEVLSARYAKNSRRTAYGMNAEALAKDARIFKELGDAVFDGRVKIVAEKDAPPAG